MSPSSRKRAKEFERNPELEALLERLEGPLAKAEAELLASETLERRPVVLIVGSARSGSTLLLQLLASSGVFGYPTNFLSRFYSAPVLGALLQQMLFEPTLSFRDELDLSAPIREPYGSQLGKTRGALAPNEFHYFWRRWLPEFQHELPDAQACAGVDFEQIERELLGVAAVFKRPLALKGHILCRILPLITERLSDCFVVNLRRDPLYTAQSLLEARAQFFGSIESWYSFRPAEYDELMERSPEEQVAAQVLLAERTVSQGLAEIDPTRVLDLTYEELCASPADVWSRVSSLLDRHEGCGPLGPSPRTDPFESGNRLRVDPATLAALEKGLALFSR